MAKKELIVLDIIEHDTVAALNYMLTLCAENKVAGMVFALALKNDRKIPRLCGATGRLATNLVEGAGVASILNLKLTRQAEERSMSAK